MAFDVAGSHGISRLPKPNVIRINPDDPTIDVDTIMNDQIDDPKKEGPKLVSENSPQKIQLLGKRQAADRAAAETRKRLRALVANILNIIAGAGEPVSTGPQIHDALKAYLDWSRAAEEAGYSIHDDREIWSPLTLDSIFPRELHRAETEEEWREWALEDPYREYIRERDRQMDRIRQIVLREIAAEIAGIDVQSRKYNGDYHEAIHRICEERKKHRKAQGNPLKPNPARRLVTRRRASRASSARRAMCTCSPGCRKPIRGRSCARPTIPSSSAT